MDLEVCVQNNIVQYVPYIYIDLFSKRLTAVQRSFEGVKEFTEGGQHYIFQNGILWVPIFSDYGIP